MAEVTLRNIHKSYGKTKVIHGVDLDIPQGEFVVFVGPSGCGKSTLLRMIAGLEEITDGDLSIDGKRVNDATPPQRGIAMVFQSYALYPHMTVFENMAFGLRIAGVKGSQLKQRVEDVASMLQLDEYLERLPKALSGGQRQRVAIGRAIVRNPKDFLFDEPLSNLDAALRVKTRLEIASLKDSLPDTTMIYVTHDQVEAMTLADRIVVLSAGRIEQVGTPLELYTRPQNLFVARFIGSPAMNILNREAQPDLAWPEGAAHCGVRPEDLELTTQGDSVLLSGMVSLVESLGEVTMLYIDIGAEEPLIVKLQGIQHPERNSVVYLRADNSALHWFDDSGMRLDTNPQKTA